MSCFTDLGLTPQATPDEVKAAWRSLAATHHPDRGGQAAEFSRLRQAYQAALAEAEAPKPCSQCGGKGRVQQVYAWSSIELQCSRCLGSGNEP